MTGDQQGSGGSPTVLAAVVPPYVCPDHAATLSRSEDCLSCPEGHFFPLRQGIPRFTESSYAEAFGRQWNRFRLTQLDSHTGIPLSEDRLRRCAGWAGGACDPPGGGGAILEAGCGAGRFTEILLRDTGAHVTSVDLSSAVDANADNFPLSHRHRIAQADIRRLPFEPRGFDYVICLGVVQHTPSPEDTIGSLWEHVKPGGWLVFDHYTWDRSSLTKIGQIWRQVFKRLPADRKLPTTERLVEALLPWHRRLKPFSRLISRVSPVLSYYHRYPDLSPALQREWSILDTHDALTDEYKHRRSTRQIRKILSRLGGEEIWVEREGNGVEARARRPLR